MKKTKINTAAHTLTTTPQKAPLKINCCNRKGILRATELLDITREIEQTATLSMFQKWDITHYPNGFSYEARVLAPVKKGQGLTSQTLCSVEPEAPEFALN
jgi:hypothetical protein